MESGFRIFCFHLLYCRFSKRLNNSAVSGGTSHCKDVHRMKLAEETNHLLLGWSVVSEA